MDELILLLWVVVFSDGRIQSESRTIDQNGMPYTEETCELREAFIWAQPAEVYKEMDYVLMFTECQVLIPRPVRGAFSE